jgi:hypothetical protein
MTLFKVYLFQFNSFNIISDLVPGKSVVVAAIVLSDIFVAAVVAVFVEVVDVIGAELGSLKDSVIIGGL